MQGLLDGKVAVITGGTSGIGLATVEAFVREGAKVVVADIQDEPGAALVGRLGDAVHYVHTDVTVEADIEAAVAAAVERFGRLDVMFNNAGTPGDQSRIVDLDTEGYDKTTDLLMRAVLLGHKYAARQFIAQGSNGSIISTSSLAGLQGGWGGVGYTSSKHAMTGIVRAATSELRGTGIRSNAIAPGLVMTPIYARYAQIEAERAEEFSARLGDLLGDEQPIGRIGQTSDIADAAVFLASDLSTWITGVVLPVDGGFSAVGRSTFEQKLGQAAAEFHG
ncbi:SDR family NAD(P)-dependent oxidoreductase [Herbiconiux sp. L3-i23]|uniref:SDR family NAD(P)-dependent oxidoreductase n=1 Tax=Herbiconiux sp. L3-i23 TaxID=2905871 RepID=UPI0020612109|nr:SDR family oxidoreductase [Herbiconiux sp. L3-i23]BDI22185.1 2,5-dichloro-2,5-cyclohexadiene-1,4-diol dehydrogenase [Herbiconiux sp. L3-i23]